MCIEVRRQENERYCQEVCRLLEGFAEGIAYRGWNNLTDWHVYAEDVMRAVLEPTFGYDLANANVSRSNAAAIDLEGTDAEGRPVVVQVSSDDSRGKVQATLDSLPLPSGGIEPHLVFVFLVERHRAYDAKRPFDIPAGIEFDPDRDILDMRTLVSHVRHHRDPDRCREVLDRLRRELGGVGAGTATQVDERFVPFYEYVYERFARDPGSELYGEMPLRDTYIEPVVSIADEDGKTQLLSVRTFLETWVDDGGTLAVICGEPGHGKTALCEKAMCDFYKEGWLAGKVANVFRFSLNPANTDALAGDSLYLDALLSWGRARKSPKHMLEAEDCRDALVFLDGFDELLEWYPRIDLEGFIRRYVASFQRETRARVVITARSMVVDVGAQAYELRQARATLARVPIARLQPITWEQQVEWIERYADWCRESRLGWSERDAQELDDYLGRYRQLVSGRELEAILGIPIIFRMVVVARFLPGSGQSMAQMYDDLFEATWERRMHRDGKPAEDLRDQTLAQLSRHALRIFCDNNDTAPAEDALESSWLFSFYTTHGGARRVGFLHRSFYQHFLAHEILSWLEGFARDGDGGRLCASLAHLARRRLDRATLVYLHDLCPTRDDRTRLAGSLARAYEMLRETDGFVPLPEDGLGADAIGTVSPLERANNVFWNVVSLCSICGLAVSTDRVNERALGTYDLEGCEMIGARLAGAQLHGARLRRANLTGASFEGANLEEADLSEATLLMADLPKARLREAHLEHASLMGAYLAGADLMGAHLMGARLVGANLEGADLKGADLRGADFERAELRGADLAGAELAEARIGRADCGGADAVR